MAAVVFTPSMPHPLHTTMTRKPSESTLDVAPRTGAKFAFACIKGDVCLVQTSLTNCETTSSALTTVDVNIFKHEFITIFRWSHQMTVHPNDIRILEPIDEMCIRYEEENGTVFMAKEVVERLRKVLSDRRGSPAVQRQRLSYSRRRY